jgi:ATP-dependent DNA ligase
VVDGEVVAIDEDGRGSFNLLQHHASNAQRQYYAFDMPVYRGRSLLQVPLAGNKSVSGLFEGQGRIFD